MRKIKIGLLIRNFNKLTNTEYRIYDKLLNSKYPTGFNNLIYFEFANFL